MTLNQKRNKIAKTYNLMWPRYVNTNELKYATKLWLFLSVEAKCAVAFGPSLGLMCESSSFKKSKNLHITN